MKYCTIFIFIFVFWQYNIVYGQFKSVQIPDSMLVKMKIDGDTSDWDWVPRKYIITEQSMHKIVSRNNNEKWSCWIKVGWSDLNQKLYIIAKVTDDIFITNNSQYYLNDCMQFVINPDNIGGRYAGENNVRANYTIKVAFVSISDKITELRIINGPDWLKDQKQYITWNVQHHNKKGGGYERIYEICLSLWDKWEAEGPEYSLPTRLFPFKRIKLAFDISDSDTPDDMVNEWTNLATRRWWMNADEIPEFVLDMSLKNGISWQSIHYILSQ